ncbi:MAG: nitrate reductase [Pseudomonadota bacterium]
MNGSGGELDGTCTTCPYCGVGCGVQARRDKLNTIQISGDKDHPANLGKLCIKGTHLAETMVPTGRLAEPEINGAPVTWAQATDHVAAQLRRTIAEHGPESVAFYLSGQLLTEDYYVANKLMKGFIGGANVDTNSRLCMASAVVAHKRAFGEDVVPCSYTDLEQCDLLVLAGSNAAWTHPVLYQRIVRAKQTRGTKVAVIDPRRTSTCDIADLHLPLRPGSDAALFNGLLTYLHDTDVVDRDFVTTCTEGGGEALAAARLELDQVAGLTGLTQEQLLEFYALFAEHRLTVTMYSQGINQSTSGTDKANAIINCHLLTGRIGAPGQGPFSITGQPNAMGGREVGGMANQLAAHMDFDPTHVDRVGRFWRAPAMAQAPGLKAVEMFDAIARGEIKAIWIMGTNPVVSLPDANQVNQALTDCPFVVVSDCIRDTATNACADVLLPAQGWGEKEGTVTNSERCISRQRRLTEPFAQAREDWRIVCEVAAKMGFAEAFAYTAPSEIFAEHARLTAFENQGERLLDLSHLATLSPTEYEQLQPTYWPAAQRPFANGRFATTNGRARMISVTLRPPEQQTSSDSPLILNTGRTRDQWHTMTRTGVTAKLFNHTDAPRLHIHPQDAQQRAITDGALVQLNNTLGVLRLRALVTEDTQPGVLFAPIHWHERFASHATVSQMVAAATDPLSGQPESKHAVVECQPLVAGRWVRLLSRRALDVEQLQTLQGMTYWATAPVAQGWQYEIALDDLSMLLPLLERGDCVTYTDSFDNDRILGRRAGHTQWLLFASGDLETLPALSHIQKQLDTELADWQKLATVTTSQQDVSAVICTCFEVREAAIRAQIDCGAASVEELGKQLLCGTNCGSCVPELNALLAQSVPRAVSAQG